MYSSVDSLADLVIAVLFFGGDMQHTYKTCRELKLVQERLWMQ
jgi:hypothetical protein